MFVRRLDIIDIGYKSPWMKTWWQEYQINVPMQVTNLYRLGFTNMYDFNDADKYSWNLDCYDSWR